MWRNRRLNRPVFLMICLSILILVAAISLFTWHFRNQPPQATCGTVLFPQAMAPWPGSNQQVERCFSRGYQQCTAITMVVNENFVDTGRSTVYWSQQQGNICQIIAQSSYSGIVGGVNSSRTETCQGVIPKNSGLLFQQCSISGDVFIAG